jgi:hypothetical protein
MVLGSIGVHLHWVAEDDRWKRKAVPHSKAEGLATRCGKPLMGSSDTTQIGLARYVFRSGFVDEWNGSIYLLQLDQGPIAITTSGPIHRIQG